MRKLKLSIDDLAVESFLTGHGKSFTGTVDARELDTVAECNTRELSLCTCDNPCTSDGYRTIDAQLCAQSGTACGSEETVAINTCRPTGWCCRTVEFTGPCCP